MTKRKDISGERFAMLVAVEPACKLRGRCAWLCLCDCGKTKIATLSDLSSGKVKSCGCIKKYSSPRNSRTHGMTHERIWTIWSGMKQRCIRNPHYRNVSVCEEWKRFEGFRDWAFSNGYSDDLTLDRINNEGNYEPSNCRWATYKQQENNRANTVYLTVAGETLPISTWSEQVGIPRETLRNRKNSDWPEEDMLMPVSFNNAKIRKELHNAQ